MGYDRALTTFSPDGRLLQVEYAKEAVKMGTLGFAFKFKDGILLAGEKRIINNLVLLNSIEKISKIDNNIYAISAGLGGDGRVLIERARFIAKQSKMVYGTNPDVIYVVKDIANIKQMYTQMGGARPFGVSIIFAGIDSTGKHIFVTEPLGIYYEYNAVAIGNNNEKVNKILSEKWKESLSEEEALNLALEIIKDVKEKEENKFEIVILKENEVKRLSEEEVDELLKKVKSKKNNSKTTKNSKRKRKTKNNKE
jgi:proteasome alpha subunit